MNKQIQNLKDKIWADEYWTKPNTDKLLPAQLNRFAELIVRECVEINKQELSFNAFERLMNKYQDHFGVE